jgi:hypothetical protein
MIAHMSVLARRILGPARGTENRGQYRMKNDFRHASAKHEIDYSPPRQPNNPSAGRQLPVFSPFRWHGMAPRWIRSSTKSQNLRLPVTNYFAPANTAPIAVRVPL